MSSRTDEMKISIVLRAARCGLGISQVDFAKELQVSQSTITRLERGAGSIAANVLLRAISFFRSHGIDISGVLEENSTIVFDARMFEVLYEKGKMRQAAAARSGEQQRMAGRNTAPNDEEI